MYSTHNPTKVQKTMTTPRDSIQSPAEKFADIAPYGESQFHEKMARLVTEPGFRHAVEYVMPHVDYDAFAQKLVSCPSQRYFQRVIMRDFLTQLERLGTDGITSSGIENIDPDGAYTFITNHRDIVLDASFLNLVMIRHDLPVTQIAIGNNLLIFDWIADLVKINRSFIVKRDVKKLEALEAAVHLSEYIHYTITQRHESVWIAQREGRAKDSDDKTQTSLIKMLSIAGGGDAKRNLAELNLMPVAISYEYDPNDFLKVREFLLKRRDPEYRKCQHDDLFSMETGLLGYKGRVHFHIAPCINDSLTACRCEQSRQAINEACELIDKGIHRGYYIYPINYWAYDQLEHSDKYADKYTGEDKAKIDEYINGQLAKVNVPDITADEYDYMHHMMLVMYANPLRNQLAAQA